MNSVSLLEPVTESLLLIGVAGWLAMAVSCSEDVVVFDNGSDAGDDSGSGGGSDAGDDAGSDAGNPPPCDGPVAECYALCVSVCERLIDCGIDWAATCEPDCLEAHKCPGETRGHDMSICTNKLDELEGLDCHDLCVQATAPAWAPSWGGPCDL
jgi:hypothetical protein